MRTKCVLSLMLVVFISIVTVCTPTMAATIISSVYDGYTPGSEVVANTSVRARSNTIGNGGTYISTIKAGTRLLIDTFITNSSDSYVWMSYSENGKKKYAAVGKKDGSAIYMDIVKTELASTNNVKNVVFLPVGVDGKALTVNDDGTISIEDYNPFAAAQIFSVTPERNNFFISNNDRYININMFGAFISSVPQCLELSTELMCLWGLGGLTEGVVVSISSVGYFSKVVLNEEGSVDRFDGFHEKNLFRIHFLGEEESILISVPPSGQLNDKSCLTESLFMVANYWGGSLPDRNNVYKKTDADSAKAELNTLLVKTGITYDNRRRVANDTGKTMDYTEFLEIIVKSLKDGKPLIISTYKASRAVFDYPSSSKNPRNLPNGHYVVCNGIQINDGSLRLILSDPYTKRLFKLPGERIPTGNFSEFYSYVDPMDLYECARNIIY